VTGGNSVVRKHFKYVGNEQFLPNDIPYLLLFAYILYVDSFSKTTDTVILMLAIQYLPRLQIFLA